MNEYLIKKENKRSSKVGSCFQCHNLEECVPPFNSSLFEIEPRHESICDSHQVKELWYIISGTGLAKIGNTTFQIDKQDTIYIPPNTKHSVINTDHERNLEIISVWFKP